jgi:hypothetical protein
MRYIAALALVVFFGLGLTPEHAQCFHEPHQDNPRPWMQGHIEVGCNRSGQQPEGDDSKEWKACSCHHTRKEGGSCEDETQGRNWDASCSTRCSPKRCLCERNRVCETE